MPDREHHADARRAGGAYHDRAGGSNLRVRSSGIVHEVAMTKWFADERMPGPACIAGVSGWDPAAAHPDRGPVTCRRCLKLTNQIPAGEQLELFTFEPDRPRPGTQRVVAPDHRGRCPACAGTTSLR
ncbi:MULTISPECIES: hypothetical protein [Streptosporangium]|uniref:Uncharacterized protein n=1 Tax=Streptosporangium brasiliense TaxID=47480 RepID=A0ABT9RG61_9ACTN|nr:hypothetical protein [Streptosporangium brasiliense]MDP9868269.1 hypothetical protein [Streptosporangium brasiliense]